MLCAHLCIYDAQKNAICLVEKFEIGGGGAVKWTSDNVSFTYRKSFFLYDRKVFVLKILIKYL